MVRERRASLDTQTYKKKKMLEYKGLRHCARVQPVDKVCVCTRLGVEAAAFARTLQTMQPGPFSALFLGYFSPLHLSPIFPFHPLPFLSLFLPALSVTRESASVFLDLPHLANAIGARNHKQTKGPKKKSEIIDLMSVSIRGRRGEEQRSEREGRGERLKVRGRHHTGTANGEDKVERFRGRLMTKMYRAEIFSP